MGNAELVIGLLAVVAILGVLADRAGVPYPPVLVVGGILLGLIPGIPTVRLPPDLVLFGFIPLLVYAAAFHAAGYDLRSHAVHIVSLATGLVLLTVVAVGVVGHLIGGIPWVAAFVFGALVAPTDPVSASAVLRKVGAPDRIVTILEGEALINDGTGLAVFQVAVASVASGFSVSHGALRLVEIAAGGCAVGLLIGWLTVRVRRPLDAPSIEIAVGLLAAFGSYVAAAAAGFSGVLAAVTTGLYTGTHAQDISSAETRLRLDPVWDATTFLLESILFLLVGLQLPTIVDGIPNAQVATAVLTGVAAGGVVIVLRTIWMVSVSPLLSRLFGPRVVSMNRRHLAVMSWSGMRGALSLAGALSIPLVVSGQLFPARDEVIFLVYLVVLGTLIVPSLTLKPLISRLKLGKSEQRRAQELRARMRVAHSALAALEDIAKENSVPEDLLSRMRGTYELRISRLEELVEPGNKTNSQRLAEDIRRQLLEAQRQAVAEMRAERETPGDVLDGISRDIDLDETRSKPHN